jgi:hypothetical protein
MNSKFDGDDIWFSFSTGFVIGAILISIIGFVFISPDERAMGWYDALCYGEVVDTAAGPSCLTEDGKIKLMPKYENRTN